MINEQVLCISSHKKAIRKLLVIYTGGTFGMRLNEKGSLVPCGLEELVQLMPELNQLELTIYSQSFSIPLDSSDIGPAHWLALSACIVKNYEAYDGFVILHGTDTMAFTASALSFLLQGLAKPVVFTGAQLPLGSVRNDARRNLESALQVASMYEEGSALIQEVVICFNEALLRANRTKKVESSHYNAFRSENYPSLGVIGTSIVIKKEALLRANVSNISSFDVLEANVLSIKLFPGIDFKRYETLMRTAIPKGIIIESFGAGNMMTNEGMLSFLKRYITNGGVVLNVSQCLEGQVVHKLYETSRNLEEIGVISGGDMTYEAALTKLMVVLGNYSAQETAILLRKSMVGELSC